MDMWGWIGKRRSKGHHALLRWVFWNIAFKKQLVECTKINENYDSFQLVAPLLEIYQNEIIKEAHTDNVFSGFGTLFLMK